MNLIEILSRRAEGIPEGPHTRGLKAIVQHAQSAVRHLERGQRDHDETAFTDAIYRTNQAFEGSLKEAYRVLANQDPERVRPFDIENYFTQQTILRQRVLDQLSVYRKEWRNPSTHDYKLDFDEDEALLAIVTVCAFAIVLFDQIAERLSFVEAQSATVTPAARDVTRPLLDAVAHALTQFRAPGSGSAPHQAREVEIVGALAGYLSKLFPDSTVETDARLTRDRAFEVDVVLKHQSEQLIIEVKQARAGAMQRKNGINQVTHYMALGGAKQGILFFYSSEDLPDYALEEHPLPGLDGRVIVVWARGRGTAQQSVAADGSAAAER